MPDNRTGRGRVECTGRHGCGTYMSPKFKRGGWIVFTYSTMGPTERDVERLENEEDYIAELRSVLYEVSQFWGGPSHHRDDCEVPGGCHGCRLADRVNAVFKRAALTPPAPSREGEVK